MVGAGGGGGGVTGVNSSGAGAGGGGGGAYLEKTVNVVAGTAYTVAIGTAGTGGANTGANGGNGGSSTITISGTTYTTPGGIGGFGMVATATKAGVQGGGGGALSTNGDINTNGSVGNEGQVTSGNANPLYSGAGANTPFGSGGSSQVNSSGGPSQANTAVGYGSGGGGALSLSAATLQQGGDGAPGVIVIEEFATGSSGTSADPLAKYIVQTATNAPANAQILASLGTGIVKNTTTTGVLSIAIAADFPTLNQNTTGSSSKATNLVGGNLTTLLGSVPYQSNTDVTSLLSPNTTTTKNFFTQTGTGTNGAAPSWGTVTKTDVGLSAVENTALSTWTGSTNITTLGTIATGTVPLANTSGTLGETRGGTNQTTYTLGDILASSATNTLSKVAGNITTTKKFLTQTGNATVSALPSWGTIANTDVSGLGTLSTQSGTFSGVSSGTNTGDQTITLTGNVTGSGTGSFATTISSNVVANTMLAQMTTLTIKGNNTGGNANVTDLTVAQVNVILPVFTSTLNGLAPLSGGGTANFLRADGTWTSPSGGSGLTWTVITASQSAVKTNGYITNGGGLVVVTLPTTAAVGDEIIVTTINATGWKIAQNASGYIQFGNTATTTGTGGSLQSTAIGDTLRLICAVANNGWQIISSVGNITIV